MGLCGCWHSCYCSRCAQILIRWHFTVIWGDQENLRVSPERIFLRVNPKKIFSGVPYHDPAREVTDDELTEGSGNPSHTISSKVLNQQSISGEPFKCSGPQCWAAPIEHWLTECHLVLLYLIFGCCCCCLMILNIIQLNSTSHSTD